MNNREQEMITNLQANKNMEKSEIEAGKDTDLMLIKIIKELDQIRKELSERFITKQILEEVRLMLPIDQCNIKNKKMEISNKQIFRAIDYPSLNEYNLGLAEVIDCPQGKYIFELLRKKLLNEGKYYAFIREVYSTELMKHVYVSERSMLATQIHSFLNEIDKINSYDIDCTWEEDTFQDPYGIIARSSKYRSNSVRVYEPYVKVIRRSAGIKK